MDIIVWSTLIMLDFTNVEHLAALVAVLGGAFAAIMFIWKKIIIPSIKWLTRVHSVFEKVDFIANELKPNGGSSLRDAIDILRNNLEKSNQRQRLLMMDSETAIFETDPQGQCTFANNAYLELVGRPFEEISGNGWVVAINPKDREKVYEAWKDAISQDRIFELDNFRYQTPEGIDTEVFCRAVPMRIINKGNIGWIGFVKPVKSKKCVQSVVS